MAQPCTVLGEGVETFVIVGRVGSQACCSEEPRHSNISYSLTEC